MTSSQVYANLRDGYSRNAVEEHIGAGLNATENEPGDTTLEKLAVEADSNLPHPPSREQLRSLSPREAKLALRDRDASAVAYSRLLLESGDTLVYITYPRGSEFYDSAGFQLSSKVHRVHSENLLATGSPQFSIILDEWKQHRLRKRKGYVNVAALPHGVKYLLDLTPPDEGDEAVELISNLSCSSGIRNWYKAESTCRVHHSLVGGQDIVWSPDDVMGFEKFSAKFNPSSETVNAVKSTTSYQMNDGKTRYQRNNDEALNRVIEKSKAESYAAMESAGQLDSSAKDRHLESRVIPEYCPIRHRAGIERILLILEGRDPCLDSAPKIWTLFGLAKYFGCEKAVLDYIVSWVTAFPNCSFIEILPERSFQIGRDLQSYEVTRSAFAILVSEEALSIACRSQPDHKINSHSRRTTQFLRLKEDIDEDAMDAIQAAATEFQSRIENIWIDLIEPQMEWLSSLPEFKKISEFASFSKNDANSQRDISKLIDALRNHVRGRILSAITQKMTWQMVTAAEEHRRAGAHTQLLEGQFPEIYENMGDDPRAKILTRFFWEALRDLDVASSPNIELNYYGKKTVARQRPDRNREIAEKYSVPVVHRTDLHDLQDDLNGSILAAIQKDGYNAGQIPASCYPIHWEARSPSLTSHANQHQAPGQKVSDIPLPRAEDSQTNMAQNFSPVKRDPFAPWTAYDYGKALAGVPLGESFIDTAGSSVRKDDKSQAPPSSPKSGFDPTIVNYGQRRSELESESSPPTFYPKTAPYQGPRDVDKSSSGKSPLTVRNQDIVDEHASKMDVDQIRDASRSGEESSVELSDVTAEAELVQIELAPSEGTRGDTSRLTTSTPGSSSSADRMAKISLPIRSRTLASVDDAVDHDGSSTSDSSASIFDASPSANNATGDSQLPYRPLPESKLLSKSAGKRLSDSQPQDSSPYKTVRIQLPGEMPQRPTLEFYDASSDKKPIFGDLPTYITPRRDTNVKPTVPRRIELERELPFFSLQHFFLDVYNHLLNLCNRMLNYSDLVEFRALTDTLLCLTDNELKFLPLWAGGCNDGTGGVYEREVPETEMGPNAPGPGFHTGMSVGSSSSTITDGDDCSTIGTSVFVENGHSDHLDHRKTYSLSGSIASSAFSDDSEDYTGKGKGKDFTPIASTIAEEDWIPLSAADGSPGDDNKDGVDYPVQPGISLENDDFMQDSDEEIEWGSDEDEA